MKFLPCLIEHCVVCHFSAAPLYFPSTFLSFRVFFIEGDFYFILFLLFHCHLSLLSLSIWNWLGESSIPLRKSTENGDIFAVLTVNTTISMWSLMLFLRWPANQNMEVMHGNTLCKCSPFCWVCWTAGLCIRYTFDFQFYCYCAFWNI